MKCTRLGEYQLLLRAISTLIGFVFLSDDHQIYKWSAKTRQSTEVAKLPDDFFPTDIHWLNSSRSVPSTSGSKGSAVSGTGKGIDSLLITSGDGRFIILNRNARVERNIAAHQSCINAGRWSPDGGTGLLTAGEDGVIKVWSKLGMLRSTIVQNENPIRTACWAPDSLAIAYCTGGFIAIKPLAANSKLIKVNPIVDRFVQRLIACFVFCSGELMTEVFCV